MVETKPKNTSLKPNAQEAQGIPVLTSRWNENITQVTPENVAKFQDNIHYRDAVNNLVRQVFPAPPEIWVTDIDGETDEPLTKKAKEDFIRLHCYDCMQFCLTDRYDWGPFVYSPGIAVSKGEWMITEIRHLPGTNFIVPPPTGNNYATPNQLTPGIIVTSDGITEVWETNPFTLQRNKLDNVRIVRSPGTPNPSGAAYMLPVYYAISQIDYASKAEFQQLARIGAPPLLPKVKEGVSPKDAKEMERWFKQFLKKWGKDNSALLPAGIEFPTLNIKEGTVAERFIQSRIDWIRTYTNPISDMQQAGTGIGTSDSGRMEIWTTFISSEQSICEHWLEELFDWILQANGYDGYHTNIRLKRPSVDKAALRLQYLVQANAAGIITKQEQRDNMTDILDLKEWTPELELQLKEEHPQSSAAGLFGNLTVDGFTRPEDKAMTYLADKVKTMNEATADSIRRIMKYPDA